MKANKNHAEIISHINHLINIDVSEISFPIKTRMLSIDVSGLSKNNINDIERISNIYKKISVQIAGHKKIAVELL